jgi:uncharacterized protein (DUF983 family)
MSFLKNLDTKLMRVCTYNFRYRDWSRAPLYFPLMIVTFTSVMAAVTIASMLRSQATQSLLGWAVVALSLLISVCHFRVWLQLKSDRSHANHR